MFCFGSGVSVPSACSSYSMKTRFQNSRKRSQRVHAGRAVRLAAAVLLAPVVVDLRVGPARPGAADRPEVLRASAAATIRSGGMPDLLPERRSRPRPRRAELRIAGEDGHPDPVRVELHVLGDELPGELDRAVLEVLRRTRSCRASRRTSGGAPSRPTSSMSGGAEALLRRSWSAAPAAARGRGRTASAAASRRVMSSVERSSGARDQRRRRAAQVALRLEEREEALAQLGGRAHPGILRAVSQAAGRGYAAGGGLSGSA